MSRKTKSTAAKCGPRVCPASMDLRSAVSIPTSVLAPDPASRAWASGSCASTSRAAPPWGTRAPAGLPFAGLPGSQRADRGVGLHERFTAGRPSNARNSIRTDVAQRLPGVAGPSPRVRARGRRRDGRFGGDPDIASGDPRRFAPRSGQRWGAGRQATSNPLRRRWVLMARRRTACACPKGP